MITNMNYAAFGRALMQQWEYYTTFLQAEAKNEAEFLEELRDWKEGIPQHTPEALIPRLNALGEQGWEMLQIMPVSSGAKGDVTSPTIWTHTYFCAFKRAKPE